MLAIALLLQAITSPTAPVPTEQGKEVVDLFDKMCVETALNSSKAHIFDSTPQIARPMTADERARTMPGDVVTEGWITKSPHDAWSALWFAPSKRTCGVTVRAADPTGMEATLDAQLRRFYDTLGARISQLPDKVMTEGGVTFHQASWLIDIGAHELAVIASFGDKPTESKQHLMTFTMLH